MRSVLIIALAAALLRGCSAPEAAANAALPAVLIDNAPQTPLDEQPEGTPLKLNVVAPSARSAKYEPSQGVYLGVYAQEDPALLTTFAFDAAAKKEHALYARQLFSGMELPSRFLLECLASGKTPVVYIYPPTEGGLYDTAPLMATAKSLAAVDAPVFAVLYPLTASSAFERNAYLDFYRRAKAVFDETAPNAAIVWQTASADDAFYPMDACDWVSLNLILHIEDGGYKDWREGLEAFYFAYQTRKPVMLTLAVSHFSSANNKYYTSQAAQAIAKLYETAGDLPRLKAVVYVNAGTAGRGGFDDYTLTSDDEARQAYREAITPKRFLSALAPWSGAAAVRSRLPAYRLDGEYYLPRKAVEGELNAAAPKKGERLIDGEGYLPLSEINRLCPVDFYVDVTDNVLTVEAI